MQKYYDHVPIEVVRQTLIVVDTNPLDVYKATDLTPSWQQAFRSGRLKDPSYTRVCMLIGWLARNHAEVFQTQLTEAKVVC